MYLGAQGARAVGNHVWGNAAGIIADGPNSAAGTAVEISATPCTTTAAGASRARYKVLAADNVVYGHTNGISVYSNYGLATRNEVFGNTTGLIGSVGGVVTENRVYANTIGISLEGGGGATAERNVVYNNAGGITEGSSRVANNLVYGNSELRHPDRGLPRRRRRASSTTRCYQPPATPSALAPARRTCCCEQHPVGGIGLRDQRPVQRPGSASPATTTCSGLPARAASASGRTGRSTRWSTGRSNSGSTRRASPPIRSS